MYWMPAGEGPIPELPVINIEVLKIAQSLELNYHLYCIGKTETFSLLMWPVSFKKLLHSLSKALVCKLTWSVALSTYKNGVI